MTKGDQQEKLGPRETFKAPLHPPAGIHLQGSSVKHISVSLIRQFNIEKMTRGTIAWHYIHLLRALGGSRMNHVHTRWALLWSGTERKPF